MNERDSDIFESDPEVSEAYQALEAQEVPAALRERVLAEARQTPGLSKRWFVGWQSFAIAASLVLAVAIVWQYTAEETAAERNMVLGGGNTDPSSIGAAADARFCDVDEDQAAWVACVAALEAAGQEAQAAAERKLLEERYPAAR